MRHRLFVEEARKILPGEFYILNQQWSVPFGSYFQSCFTAGERLTHCPLCTSPSRVSASKAECSSSKCNFVFCPDCLCENHEGRCVSLYPISPMWCKILQLQAFNLSTDSEAADWREPGPRCQNQELWQVRRARPGWEDSDRYGEMVVPRSFDQIQIYCRTTM